MDVEDEYLLAIGEVIPNLIYGVDGLRRGWSGITSSTYISSLTYIFQSNVS